LSTALILFCLTQSTAYPAVPSMINFQGRLTDNAGQPLTDIVGITFSLYDSPTGGILKWSEIQNNVTVTNGMLNVAVGSITAITPEILAADELWLEIKLGNDTLNPRQKVAAAPYSIIAENSNKLSGRTYDMFVSTGGGMVNGELKSLVGGTTFYMVPAGAIIMWAGTKSTIPVGWVLCDGSNGTPDLSDRFIVSISTSEEPGITGGANTIVLSTSTLPAHTHTGTTLSDGNHTHSIHHAGSGGTDSRLAVGKATGQYDGLISEPAGVHTHTFTSNPTGAGVSIDIRPKYFKLAFIMKL